ncbi:MAG: DUF6034 family protein [Clostridiaceae bacterium]|nr:DUF6034 family protein [Clostridiaceae bacterium]
MRILSLLLEISVYSAVIYAVTLLLKKGLYKKLSPALHYGIWIILLLRLLMPFTIDSGINLIVIPAQAPKAQTQSMETLPAFVSGNAADPAAAQSIADVTASDFTPNRSSIPEQIVKSENLSPAGDGSAAVLPSAWSADTLLLALWLTGAGIYLIYIISAYILLKRHIRRDAVYPAPQLQTLFNQCRSDLGVNGKLRILGLYGLSTPALFIPFTILMPMESLVSMNPQQIRYALQHELVHYKRKDHLVIILLCLLQAVYWFNPIIWLAFRQIRLDMEAACDHAVVKLMNGEEKSSYAMMVLSLFTRKQQGQFVLGMAPGKTRKAAEQRIHGIFMENRSKPGAKIVSAVLTMMLLISCFTTACQPTPESPVVVGKDGEKLEEIINAAPSMSDTPIQTASNTHYTGAFAGADDTVTVQIDADIVKPDKGMPVVTVKPHVLSIEQVKSIAQVLFRNQTVYEPQIIMTKANLDTKIKELTAIIKDEPALLKNYGGNQDTVDKVKAKYKACIAKYEQMIADAPDTIALRETDWIFRSQLYYMDRIAFDGNLAENTNQAAEIEQQYSDSESIQFVSTIGNYHAFMEVTNSETDEYVDHLAVFYLGSNINGAVSYWNPEDSRPMEMTRDETILMVKDALSQMGITHIQLTSCTAQGSVKSDSESIDYDNQEDALAAAAASAPPSSQPAEGEDVYGYNMKFSTTYQDVASHDMESFNPDNAADQYGPVYQYEQLYIQVRNGMITYFFWFSPLEPVTVENENVATLTFEEALAAFTKQSQLSYTLASLSRHASAYQASDSEDLTGNTQNMTGKINITDIRLDLMRICIKNHPGVYRMVPVWTFTGNEQLFIQDRPVQASRDIPTYIAINALDGSIIDMSQGY